MIISAIKECPLFAGIEEHRLEPLLKCLNSTNRDYVKDEFIFSAENKAEKVGIVISGGVHIIQEDFWGNRVILTHVKPGGLFGEAFSCAGLQSLPVSVIASESLTRVMLIDYRKIVKTCTSACVFHTRLIMNMLFILAQKNILLTRKMEHLSKRTIRERILSYLSAQAVQSGGEHIEIPFNRQELADYLCVDRSALSRELAIMQREKLIRYNKNRFELLRDDDVVFTQ